MKVLRGYLLSLLTYRDIPGGEAEFAPGGKLPPPGGLQAGRMLALFLSNLLCLICLVGAIRSREISALTKAKITNLVGRLVGPIRRTI